MNSLDLTLFNNIQKQRILLKTKGKLSLEKLNNEIVEEKRTSLSQKQELIKSRLKDEEIGVESKRLLNEEMKESLFLKRLHNRVKAFSIFIFIFILLALVSFGVYYVFRLATESPIIKNIETVKEVKITEIPEECTQIRRNGKVYMSCDGVKIEGAPTIGASGIKDIPELITD